MELLIDTYHQGNLVNAVQMCLGHDFFYLVVDLQLFSEFCHILCA